MQKKTNKKAIGVATTRRVGIEEITAYCAVDGCEWHVENARGFPPEKIRASARTHVNQTGHTVDVYVETRYRIKFVPLK